MDAQANASPDGRHDQPVDACSFPSQLLAVEVLRRPPESAQYTSVIYTERLAEHGIAPSVGTVGDSFDNAMAESAIGLYKTELIRRQGPWRTPDQVEIATLEYIDWFNFRRLHGEIGYVPPAEFEEVFYASTVQEEIKA